MPLGYNRAGLGACSAMLLTYNDIRLTGEDQLQAYQAPGVEQSFAPIGIRMLSRSQLQSARSYRIEVGRGVRFLATSVPEDSSTLHRSEFGCVCSLEDPIYVAEFGPQNEEAHENRCTGDRPLDGNQSRAATSGRLLRQEYRLQGESHEPIRLQHGIHCLGRIRIGRPQPAPVGYGSAPVVRILSSCQFCPRVSRLVSMLIL